MGIIDTWIAYCCSSEKAKQELIAGLWMLYGGLA